MNYKTDKPCLVCGLCSSDMVCLHHIKTRKAWPEFKDKAWNLMPLCLSHHNQIHSIGLESMSRRYNSVDEFLFKNGWKFNTFYGKWEMPDETTR